MDEFGKNDKQYINDATQKITELMQYKNVFRIEENSNLLLNVQKRKLYKLCPFHIEDKESWADALIIETLINIRDFIEIKDGDQIYFITRNHKDFSKGKSKTEKELIHPHIEDQLIKNELIKHFCYRSLYTKTLLEDFSEETKEANIYQSLMEEAEEERSAMIDDWWQNLNEMERESAGLPSLSSDDTYIDRISDSNEVNELISTYDSLLSSLNTKIENIIEEYNEFVDDMNAKSLTDLITKINVYNVQSPFLQISYENSFTEEEIRESILDFVNDHLCPIMALETSFDSINYIDYFELNELLSFTDLDYNRFSLSVVGHLDPRNDDKDSVWIELHKNDNRISYGEIEVYYGYLNFDEDGGASDGSADSIDYHLEKVINDLKNVVNGNIKSINEMSSNLIKMRVILSI